MHFAASTEKKVPVNNKIQEVRFQRDLIGRMLKISMYVNGIVEKILTYLLKPVSRCMCHFDEYIYKACKSALFKSLERNIQWNSPTNSDICLIDEFFIKHCITNLPKRLETFPKIPSERHQLQNL